MFSHPGPAPYRPPPAQAPLQALRLTCRVQPKTPIMSIATVRYSASTSHQGLSTLKAGCCSVNCLNSATGIIFPAGEGEAEVAETLKRGRLVVGPQRVRHVPLLPICALICPNLAHELCAPFPSPPDLTSFLKPSYYRSLHFCCPGSLPPSDAAGPFRGLDGQSTGPLSPNLPVWPSPGTQPPSTLDAEPETFALLSRHLVARWLAPAVSATGPESV